MVAGRADGHKRDRDVHGRVEKRQAQRLRNQRALRRPQVRGRVVQQQEVRLRRHHPEGRLKGGGQVQEQRAHHLAQEKAPLPHSLGEIQGANRRRRQRSAARLQNRAAEG